MTESDFSNPSSSLPASGLGGAGVPGVLGKGLSLVRSAAQAGTSLVKTQLLRQDRTTEAEYQHRMSICQSCPGGHATFHADGSLNTCGPMLKSMAGSGNGVTGKEGGKGGKGGSEGGKEGAERKTCGCVLSGKARDRKQGCPFNYWPTLPEKAPASPATPGVPGGPGALPGVATGGASNGGNIGGLGGVRVYSPADQKRYEAAMAGGRSGHLGGVGGVRGGGGYLLDPSRRRFLGQSAAAMVGLMATRLAFGDGDKLKYIPIQACGSGSKKYVLCGNVQGKRVNDVFADDQGDCYQIASAKPQELGSLGSSAATPSSWAPESERSSCEFCKYYEVKKCSDSSVVGYIKKKDFYTATGNKSTGKTTSGDCVKLGSVQDPIPPGGTIASLQGNMGYSKCCVCTGECCECGDCSFPPGTTLKVEHELLVCLCGGGLGYVPCDPQNPDMGVKLIDCHEDSVHHRLGHFGVLTRHPTDCCRFIGTGTGWVCAIPDGDTGCGDCSLGSNSARPQTWVWQMEASYDCNNHIWYTPIHNVSGTCEGLEKSWESLCSQGCECYLGSKERIKLIVM